MKFCGCQGVSSELRTRERKPQVRPNLQMQNYGNEDEGYMMRQNLWGIGFWLTCKEKAGWGKVETCGKPTGRAGVGSSMGGYGSVVAGEEVPPTAPEGHSLPGSWP